MNDLDLLGLCVLQEAAGESDDGRAAVARVIKNRMALKYASDGTVAGTILKYDQFSWLWFKYTGGHPHRIAWAAEDAAKVAADKLAEAPPMILEQCLLIASDVMSGKYHGPLYDKLTDDVVLYLNPNPQLVPHLPAWASPDKLVCVIGHHEFFRA